MIEPAGSGALGEVTIGEVNRNVMRLEKALEQFMAKQDARDRAHETRHIKDAEHHQEQHREEERDRDTSGRWIVTTAIAIGGLIIALLTAAANQPGV